MATELEMRLIGAESPEGEVPLSKLWTLAKSLHELSLRLGRAHLESGGPGRSKRTLEEITEIRLRGVTDGSTKLSFSRGPTDVLDVELSLQTELDASLWKVFDAVATDRRPEWVSDLVSDSAADLVQALQGAAPRVDVSQVGRKDVILHTARLRPETWRTRARTRTEDEVQVSGRLEKVDLKSHDFRIRDDAGNPIELEQVQDVERAGALVGTRVRARGRVVSNRSGRLAALCWPALEPDTDPVLTARVPTAIPLDAILASASGPDPDGGLELTDEEFDAFLEAIKS